MLKGAANTLAETTRQIHPSNWSRKVPFARKWEERTTTENTPKLKSKKLTVNICKIYENNENKFLK